MKRTFRYGMLYGVAIIVGLMIVLTSGVSTAATATWDGTVGSWTNAADWDTADYPGELDNSAGVTIRGPGVTVTLDTDLPNSIGGGAYTAPFTLDQNANLNIGGDITATAAVYLGGWGSSTITHTSGTFNVVTGAGRVNLLDGGNGTYDSYYNLSGGILDIDIDNVIFGYAQTDDSDVRRGTLNISGTGAVDIQNANVYLMTVNVSGGSFASSGTYDMDKGDGASGSGGTDYTPIFHVDGKGASSITFNTLKAFNDSEAESYATLQFTLDASGVTKMTVTSLNLGTGSDRSVLAVNVTSKGDTGSTGVELIDYSGSITGDGTFSSTNITDDTLGALTPGTKGSLELGEYAIDYADGDVGDGTSIVLYYNISPPKGTVISIN